MVIFHCNGCTSDPSKKITGIYTVEIKAMKFHPAELVVNTGDTVVWLNHDFVDHDITEDPGKGWSSSKIPNGGSWRMVIKSSSDYFCSIHQVMKGRLTVRQ